jgi:hypothetical protein
MVMIDTSTRQRLKISTDGGAAPYLMLPESQLAAVRELLEKNDVPHWVDEETLSMDGGPDIALVNFGREIDPPVVQCLLDALP